MAKRCFDLLLVGVALIMVLPLMAGLAVLIYLRDPGPVIYRHTRIGKDGRAFDCFKFRTMVVNADKILTELLKTRPELKDEWAQTHKLCEDPRIIPKIGSFLRRSSLDELPQLFNKTCGSFCKPRLWSCAGVALSERSRRLGGLGRTLVRVNPPTSYSSAPDARHPHRSSRR